jgi:molecular chaperone Hsp33
MLQTLPAEQEDKDLSFEHVVQLANTLHGDELLKLDNATILHRLYHQEVVRTFTSQPLRFGCSCSLARMENALLGIGKEEAMSILAERAYIEVTCEFCHRQYQFDQIEIEKLFKRGTSSIEQPPTKH